MFEEGSSNADNNGYVATHNGTPTFGTTNITFSQFSAGQISAGTGLTKTGNTINAIAGTGITINANDIQISDTYKQDKKYNYNIRNNCNWYFNGTVIDEVYGGTGQSSYTTGDILYASGVNTLAKLALGNNGKILQSNGSNVLYGDVDGGTY